MRSCLGFGSLLLAVLLVAVVAFAFGVMPAVESYGENIAKAAEFNSAAAVRTAEINAAAAVRTAETYADRDKWVAAFNAAQAGTRELGGITRLALVSAVLVILGVLLGIGLLIHQSLRYGAVVRVQSRKIR